MILDPPILWWLLDATASEPDGLEAVMTMGSGSLPEGDLRPLLFEAGVEFSVSDESTSVLVLGRDSWTELRLGQLLDARSGQRLRVRPSLRRGPSLHPTTCRR